MITLVFRIILAFIAYTAPVVETEPPRVPVSDSAVVARMNAERASAGVAPLRVDARAIVAAQARVEYIVLTNEVAHRPVDDPHSYVSELTRAGLPPSRYYWAGENLGRSEWPNPVALLISMTVDSPTHRANMLSPDFNTVGVAHTCNAQVCFFAVVFVGMP